VNPSKTKGTAQESALVMWFRGHGWPHAKRRTMKGARDEGDLDLGDGYPITIESKAVKTWTPAGWMKELEAEVENARAVTGAVIVKKRGTTDCGEYYVVMPLKYYNDLLLKAIQPEYQKKRRRLVKMR
jgi:hypothetical protein